MTKSNEPETVQPVSRWVRRLRCRSGRSVTSGGTAASSQGTDQIGVILYAKKPVKLTFNLGPNQMTEADQKAAAEAVAKAKD
jgi:hypothetical protein